MKDLIRELAGKLKQEWDFVQYQFGDNWAQITISTVDDQTVLTTFTLYEEEDQKWADVHIDVMDADGGHSVCINEQMRLGSSPCDLWLVREEILDAVKLADSPAIVFELGSQNPDTHFFEKAKLELVESTMEAEKRQEESQFDAHRVRPMTDWEAKLYLDGQRDSTPVLY